MQDSGNGEGEDEDDMRRSGEGRLKCAPSNDQTLRQKGEGENKSMKKRSVTKRKTRLMFIGVERRG